LVSQQGIKQPTKALKEVMTQEHPHDPLYGKTLESILTFLVEEYTFPVLAEEIKINCFTVNPTMKSSLVFLRRTPWARKKVEELYIITLQRKEMRAR
jgi:uncharacterized protein (DUF2132 family)